MDHHKILNIGPKWANSYEFNINYSQPKLPQVVMTYHDLATLLNLKLMNHHIIVIGLQKMFSIGPQWVNRCELNVNFTQPYLP